MLSLLDATLYVSNSGSDTNPGTKEQPFKTVQKAVSMAQPGDVIGLFQGIYNEAIGFPRSGLAGSPITLRGEKDSIGKSLAIIDLSTAVTPYWVPAAEVGPGVYKHSSIGFNPYVMLLDGKQVIRIDNTRMKEASGTSEWTGFDVLAYPADKTIVTMYGNKIVPFWDGVDVVYGVRDGVTYIRFKNGDDPNNKNLRASPSTPAVDIQNQSYIVLEQLHIRGSNIAVYIRKNANNNIVQDSILEHGSQRVYITGAGDVSLPSNNIIRRNDITLGYGAFNDFGEWGKSGGVVPDSLLVREQTYINFKYLSGYSSSNDYGVRLYLAGRGNEVSDNHIYQGLCGVAVDGTSAARVSGNTINNMSSIGIILSPGSDGTEVFDNIVSHCNINFRIHRIGESGDMNRTLYIYRNRSYLDEGAGEHIFYHSDANYVQNFVQGLATPPEVWWYHNSFSGGDDWSSATSGALAKVKVLNNIISSNMFVYGSLTNIKNPLLMELCDYNWIGGIYHHGVQAFTGPHNIIFPYRITDVNVDYEAGDANFRFWTPTGSVPDFIIPDNDTGRTARAAGIDLSRPFTLNGSSYPALPGMVPGHFTGTAPDLGAFQGINNNRAPGDVNDDRVVDVKDLILIALDYGKTAGFNPYCDINKDSIIDVKDMILAARNYGRL